VAEGGISFEDAQGGGVVNLREARVTFTWLSVKLVEKAKELGFESAWDEVTNHQNVGHKPGSLHYYGCALDLILYKDGIYVPDTEPYRPLGEYWKTLHPYCKWGGDFKDFEGKPQPDGNHFSLSPPELFGNRA